MGLVLNDNTEDFSIFERINFLTNIFNLETMKTSKVKAVQANGTWQGEDDLLFKFEYLMEDGQIVNAMHKTSDGFFKEGQEVEYEIRNAKYNSGGVKKPSQGFSQPQQVQPKPVATKTYVDNTKGIKIGHAITNGVSIFLSNGSYEAMDMKESIKAYAKMIHQISEELNNEL